MSNARSVLIVGPAKLVRSTGISFTKDNFSARFDKALTPIVVDAYGHIDDRDEDLIVKVPFTPEGRWNLAHIAFLWPYLNPTVGSDIFGTSDTPTVIHDSNSHKHTIIASAVTKMPSLTLSAGKTMIGDAEISGVRGSALGWTDASSLYTVATSAGTLTDTGFSTSLIKVQTWSAAWGAVTGFTAITTEDGWTIDFDTQLFWVKTDDIGTQTAKLVSVSIMASCTPLGISQTNIDSAYYAQVASGARGRSNNANSADLTITGADTTSVIVVKGAALVKAGYRFGAKTLRDGQMGWVATRSFSSGVAGALATMTAAA